MRLRREVRRFAEAMEERLQRHDASRGNSWLKMPLTQLRDRLREEMAEFAGAIRWHRDDWFAIRDEAADAGNFLMFIVEVLGRETPAAAPAVVHFREKPFVRTGVTIVAGRVGCGKMIPVKQITALKSAVTCPNCKRSLWFRNAS